MIDLTEARKEFEKKRLASVSKALAKMLEIKHKSDSTKWNAKLNTKFQIKYNRLFNHYKSLCKKYYY